MTGAEVTAGTAAVTTIIAAITAAASTTAAAATRKRGEALTHIMKAAATAESACGESDVYL